MTTTAVLHVPLVHVPSPVFDALDAPFQRRWIEWKARGRAHDQQVNHRALVAAIAVGVLALAAAALRAYVA